MQVDLSGKTALITGASRDLGAYYAETLAKQGARVIVSGRPSTQAKLEAVVAGIIQQGGDAIPLLLDLNDSSQFHTVIASLINQHQQLDILVNNAAVSKDAGLFEIDELSWDNHFNTNLKGIFFLTQTVAKFMRKQAGNKHIINIAAVNGHKVRRNCIPFSTSKAGVIHLTKLLAYELAPYKIHVNALALGLIASEGVRRFLDNDPKAADYLSNIPLKRAGQFSDIVAPLLLLASDASNYMTGSVLEVDGGFACDPFLSTEIRYSD